jgi:hypothetical protein
MPCAGRQAEQSKNSPEFYVCISRRAILYFQKFTVVILYTILNILTSILRPRNYCIIYKIMLKYPIFMNNIKINNPTRRSSRRIPIQKAIFKTLARRKAVSLELLKKEVGDNIKDPYSNKDNQDYAISRSMKNLIQDGLVECFQSESQPYFRLSILGKKKLNSNALVDDTALISNNWDGYWRIIIINLPEERKNEREALRYLLKKAGFVCLKNSIWISMYPYEHLFINIKKDLNLTSEMMIIVTDKIDELTQNEFLSSIKK